MGKKYEDRKHNNNDGGNSDEKMKITLTETKIIIPTYYISNNKHL